MNDIGVFTPEQARALWQDYQRRQQLSPHISQNYPQRRPIDEVSPHRVFVRNDSGETIPRYGCMQITGTVTTGSKTFVTVTKPTTTDGEYLFCAQFAIAVDGYGWAYRYDVIVMLGDGTAPTAAGVAYAPVVGQWYITEDSGPFIVWGESNAATDAVVGRFAGGGGGTHEVWATIDSVECDQYTSQIEYVMATPTYYTGGCNADAIPGIDSYGMIRVEAVCPDEWTAFWTKEQLEEGKILRATYMKPLTGACEWVWLLDGVCGQPICS